MKIMLCRGLYQRHLRSSKRLLHWYWHSVKEISAQSLELSTGHLGLEVDIIHQPLNLDGKAEKASKSKHLILKFISKVKIILYLNLK